MFRSLRFSIWDLFALTLTVAVFASNFSPREITLVDPIPGTRFWQLGFPIVWTKFATPTDESVLRMAIQNGHLLLLNAMLCFVTGLVIRKLPAWTARTKDPAANPAKALLYFYGLVLLFLALSTFAAALVGATEARGIWVPERPAPTLAASIGSAIAILLARGEFDRLNRSLTIGWGMVATFAMLYLSFVTFSSPVLSPVQARGQIITLLVTASLASVAWLAWQKPAFSSELDQGQVTGLQV